MTVGAKSEMKSGNKKKVQKGKPNNQGKGQGKPQAMGVSEKSKTPMKNKNKRPIKKVESDGNKVARAAIASGEVVKNVDERKESQDCRTLYIRFNEKFPREFNEIKCLHSDIKNVRAPRLAAVKAGKKQAIKYAFIEFENEENAIKAKNKLATTQFQGHELVVDYVGEKSKKKGPKAKGKAEFNPLRLFVSGLTTGVTKQNLKEMFPKSSGAEIPRSSKTKGTSYGFVQFSNPGDAKAAFDAAKGLNISGHPITVLFAKKTAVKEQTVAKKEKKRKAKEENEKNKKAKLDEKTKKDDKKVDEPMEEDDSDDDESDGEDVLKEKESDVKDGMKSVKKDEDNEANENDDDSENDEDGDESDSEEEEADTEEEKDNDLIDGEAEEDDDYDDDDDEED